MKKLAFLLTIAIMTSFGFVNAQDEAEMTRSEKRKAEREKNYQILKKVLEEKNFVLESDYLQDRYGFRVPVNSNINFVMVSDSTGVIQIGSPHTYGPNGVGGVTAKGTVTKWELDVNDKKKSFNLTVNVMTPIGMYDLQLWINSNGNATATLHSLRGGRLTFDGDVVALENSIVYEGESL